ncbi:hypothetical protein H0H93_005215 [Arthromyces matolae]|nr:hypothetical protein H0H93_005215 [Arthromyces matolae]
MQALGQDRIPTDNLPGCLAIRNLWKTQIVVNARKSSSSTSAELELEFDKTGFRALKRATILLPPESYIRLEVVYSSGTTSKFNAIHSSSVIRLLPFVKQLDWQGPFHSSLFNPGSLEGIEQLSIKPPWKEKCGVGKLSPDRFGPFPKLQQLRIQYTTPEFLYSRIPWSRLRSLTLDSSPVFDIFRVFPTFEIVPWRSFFMNSSIDLSSLQELSLRTQSQLLDIILGANIIPWQQLTSLDISTDSVGNLPLLLDSLHASTALVSLDISIRGAYKELDSLEDHPITLPVLQSLTATSITLPVITHLISPSALLSLCTGGISLSNFYLVVQQCPRLASLDAVIFESENLFGSNAITLPCLTHLRMTFPRDPDEWTSTSFPTLLATPNLSSLTVFVIGSGPFPLSVTAALIKRSGARLSNFDGYIDQDNSVFVPKRSLLALLTALEGAHTVSIIGVMFPPAILDKLAQGNLLPHVKDLTFSAQTLEHIESTINSRLKYEEKRGRVNLRNISGYIARKDYDIFYLMVKAVLALGDDDEEFSDTDEEEEQESFSATARKISERYGIQCKLEYTMEPVRRFLVISDRRMSDLFMRHSHLPEQ